MPGHREQIELPEILKNLAREILKVSHGGARRAIPGHTKSAHPSGRHQLLEIRCVTVKNTG